MVIHSDSFVDVMLPFMVALAMIVLVLISAGMLAFGKFRPDGEDLAGFGWVGCCVRSGADRSLASYSAKDRERRPGLLCGHLVYRY